MNTHTHNDFKTTVKIHWYTDTLTYINKNRQTKHGFAKGDNLPQKKKKTPENVNIHTQVP